MRRFIPACTGNSIQGRRPNANSAVHPRVYGELTSTRSPGWKRIGSSPRVRGTLETLRLRCCVRRFIPACTGNSTGPKLDYNGVPGSSPRVRGTRRHRRHRRHCTRFIPACTGNSTSVSLISGTTSGSSPRVRGTPCATAAWAAPARFIPACTGNSITFGRDFSASSVHPRVYGELNPIFTKGCNFSGSSPRVRGTPPGRREPYSAQRFIPACTGNSERHVLVIDGITVHPRVYGELVLAGDNSLQNPGSSPRVRGTPTAS